MERKWNREKKQRKKREDGWDREKRADIRGAWSKKKRNKERMWKEEERK